jgi:uncharacterized protein
MEGRAVQLTGEPEIGPETAETTPAKPRGKRRFAWRPWLRALHRDAGYFVIGLTVIYALSGLAVNHIKDWDPNFQNFEHSYQLKAAIPEDDDAAGKVVLGELGVHETPREVYRADDQQLDIVFDKRTFHVDTTSGKVQEEGQNPRPFLRMANWLHLNRGKKAWTMVADSYALILLGLSISGLFMIPGRKGLFGRGAVIALLGAAIPVAYVVWSGGPNAAAEKARTPAPPPGAER